MAAILIDAPASEPLSLADAKNYLRVTHDTDDALVLSLIAAARVQVETHTRRALITQSWRIVIDRWPASGAIASPVSPLREVLAARVRNVTGEAEELDPDILIPNTASSPGLIVFDAGRVVHPTQDVAGIEIDIEAGYGAAATSTIRAAMRLSAMRLSTFCFSRAAMPTYPLPQPSRFRERPLFQVRS